MPGRDLSSPSNFAFELLFESHFQSALKPAKWSPRALSKTLKLDILQLLLDLVFDSNFSLKLTAKGGTASVSVLGYKTEAVFDEDDEEDDLLNAIQDEGRELSTLVFPTRVLYH